MPDTTVKEVKQSYWAGNTLVPAGTILGANDPLVIAAHVKDKVVKSTS